MIEDKRFENHLALKYEVPNAEHNRAIFLSIGVGIFFNKSFANNSDYIFVAYTGD